MQADQYENKIFVYGTLMNPEIRGVFCQIKEDKIVDGAKIYGFRRYRVKNQHYPAVFACEGAEVEGQMLSVDNEELRKFDMYEAIDYGLYVKTKTEATLPDGSQCEVTVYTKGPKMQEEDLYGDWSYEKYMEGR